MNSEQETLEDLWFDRNRRLSSGPRAKSGPNRGRHHVERGGKWEEINAHWLEGKRRAQRALGMEEE